MPRVPLVSRGILMFLSADSRRSEGTEPLSVGIAAADVASA